MIFYPYDLIIIGRSQQQQPREKIKLKFWQTNRREIVMLCSYLPLILVKIKCPDAHRSKLIEIQLSQKQLCKNSLADNSLFSIDSGQNSGILSKLIQESCLKIGSKKIRPRNLTDSLWDGVYCFRRRSLMIDFS